MKSIRTRLISTYLIIIFVTLALFETFLLFAIKKYYYDNINQILDKQGEYSSILYNTYLYKEELEDNLYDIIQSFTKNTTAQVQIFNKKGEKLIDSVFPYEDKTVYEDAIKTLSGQKTTWTGTSPQTGEKIMAVSYPLERNGTVVGVVRLVSSLSYADSVIFKIRLILIGVSLAILIIVTLISILLSKTITNPIKQLTLLASRFASGELTATADIKSEDEIGLLSESLGSMAKQIKHQQELKDGFIASVSHDLRTPLTSIKGWAVTLKTGELGDHEMLLDGLEIIEKESDRLTSMVNSLLDFSKLELGRVGLNLTKININSLMVETIRDLNPIFDSKVISVKLQTSGEKSELFCDSARIKQVFGNILDNAIKHTNENGNIYIHIAPLSEKLLISIKDTGCGILPEDLPRIKEKFYRGKNSKNGTGLGLAICEEIVKLHKGALEIQSIPGRGTEVIVFLPW